MDEVKIVALNGSPRKQGNTARMLKEITKEHADVDLDYYDLNDLKIRDCQACFYCKTHDTCAVKDDMQVLYQKIKAADALVIGSPVYFGAETATTKAFLDRMYAMLDFDGGPGKYISKLKGPKKAILIFTCGNPKGAEVYSHLKDRSLSAFAMLGFKQVKPYVIGGVDPKGNILELTAAQDVVRECQQLLEE